ncbi:MAG: sensor histidine kinase [Pikeienuella sp.]
MPNLSPVLDTGGVSGDLRIKFALICTVAMICFSGLLALDNTLARQHVRAVNTVMALEKTRASLAAISIAAFSVDEGGPVAQRKVGAAATNLRHTAADDLRVRHSPLGFSDEVASAALANEMIRWADLADGLALAPSSVAEVKARFDLRAENAGDLLLRMTALQSMTAVRVERLRRAETIMRVAGMLVVGAVLSLIWRLVIRPLVDRQHAVLKRLRRNEHAARELAARTARADEAKANFLSVISHELRTPMNGILGCAELIRATSQVERDKTLAETICTSGADLMAIVSDILDFTELKSGELQLFEGAVDAEQLADETNVKFMPVAAANRTKLRVRLLGDPERIRSGDMTRVTQVLSNLVDNAIRFTKRGAVYVTIDNRFGRALTLIVRDTGVGMAPPEVASAFDPFTQADGGATRSRGGAGMGLTIVKKLADAMGGEVRLQSRVGAGTTVTFSAPLPFSDAALSKGVPEPREDEQTSAKALSAA